MAKIAILITNLFEDSEYTKPAEAFRNAGHELVHIGFKAGDTVKGKKVNTPVTIDLAGKDALPEDYDALLIPGGYSPDQLRVDEDIVEFTRDFVQSGKPVFAICHAPQLLITARVLDGCRMTGYKSLIQDIKNAGAEYIDQEVVEDGNLVTSREPKDLPAFIDASLRKLEECCAGRPQERKAA